MTDFTNLFKNRSNSELLKIIDNPDDYQPLAVEVAKNIFASRQLTDPEIRIAKAELESQGQEKDAQNQKIKLLENNVKNFASSLSDSFNPIQTSSPTTDKIIKIISIVLGGLFLYQVFKDFEMIKFLISSSDAKWDFSSVLYFLMLLMLPTATILFFARKKLGWALLAFFLTYSTINAIFLFYVQLNIQPSGIPAIDNLIPNASPVTHIGTIIFLSGCLLVNCRDNIRVIYTVDKRTMFITIGIIGILTALALLKMIK